jgi:hypothetical protein
MIEQVHPGEGGKFHGLEVSSRATLADDLGLVQADGRPGQGVIVRIADAANRRFNAASSAPLLSRARDGFAVAPMPTRHGELGVRLDCMLTELWLIEGLIPRALLPDRPTIRAG